MIEPDAKSLMEKVVAKRDALAQKFGRKAVCNEQICRISRRLAGMILRPPQVSRAMTGTDYTADILHRIDMCLRTVTGDSNDD